MNDAALDAWHMGRALELAAAGRGAVEPNPLVGCVIAQGAEIIGDGWHRAYGGPHAEVEALAVAGHRAAGGTLYVTLEPCCHWGKTPPCTQAVIASGVRRVVVAMADPFPAVSGQGVAELRAAGIVVEIGLLTTEARRLNAPYLKLLDHGRPWVIAKWAMTLDGKIASHTGHSRWISGERSRRVVHALRGRVDAIAVGLGTADADDPLLTARPAGPRVATRIVFDHRALLATNSQLVQTAAQVPLLVAAGPEACEQDCRRLIDAGCEVFRANAESPNVQILELLDELGRRRMTNLLVEGGSRLLGSFFDAGQIDEVHAFVAPKLIGGGEARSPIGGEGLREMSLALQLHNPEFSQLDGDVYLHGHVARPPRHEEK
jgi:diaminohydroxyphosphoribosylaminopyrimidine deaminase/5-amino-6-(5-phosphoribosylamino)uracil reductase